MCNSLYIFYFSSVSNPLTSRYASKEMINNFGECRKIVLWRQLWIWLAESQKELGLPITDEQINEMKQNIANIDLEKAASEEKMLRHDVMAHVHTYGAVCPKAAPIIHLGATSCFVTCNADILILHNAFHLLSSRLANSIANLKDLAIKYKDLAILGRTHLQPAQPTTLGKRFCLWLQDLLIDLDNFERIRDKTIRFRSIKGAVGTQASFLDLFDGDETKVLDLEKKVAHKAGFENRIWKVTGQTYPRKMDVEILSALSNLGASLYKIANDIRLLASMKEIEEPFETSQIGSSAMPYKRNPIRCERLCSISRYLIAQVQTALNTHATQWLERSLDDSAIRRITLTESCLAADACLLILLNVLQGIVVYDKIITKHLEDELPFMASEVILMRMTKRGLNRQECHEKIRVHSQEAGKRVKLEGKQNDLIERLRNDIYFDPVKSDLDCLLDPKLFIGLAPTQVIEFCKEVETALLPYIDVLKMDSKIKLKV